ncbi:hypothetical protein SAMN05421759_1092 [Roseivivax lentus]|uniref:Uncharacterized protein n=1 Tax=Roseivivax lentus TaxID=633194 RepID=A0A1N7NM40_9RHOB|nr:hypothetical protein [Roseivivax lentus]SIS99249.1 hypothetical protein SAMN05421759_1092 [Roseivivax lentus]
MTVLKFPLPPCVEVTVLLSPTEAFHAAALGGLSDEQLGCATLWGTMQDNPKLRLFVTENAAAGLHGLLRQHMFNWNGEDI